MNDQEQLKVVDGILEVLDVMNTILQDTDNGWCQYLSAQIKHLNATVDQMRPVEITSDMVLELRAATGEGLMACKKALVKSRGSMVKAKEIMRCN